MCRDLRRVRHDGRVVLERIADVAILIRIGAVGPEIELIRIGYVVVPLITVVFPGDIGIVEVITNARRRRRRNRERRVGWALVDEGIVAVAEPARIVVVDQIVVIGLAARIDVQPGEVGNDWFHARLTQIRAVGIGTTAENDRQPIGFGLVPLAHRESAVEVMAVAVLRVPVVGAGLRIRILDLADRSWPAKAGGIGGYGGV